MRFLIIPVFIESTRADSGLAGGGNENGASLESNAGVPVTDMGLDFADENTTRREAVASTEFVRPTVPVVRNRSSVMRTIGICSTTSRSCGSSGVGTPGSACEPNLTVKRPLDLVILLLVVGAVVRAGMCPDADAVC
jgi:hypothetical protein